MEEREEKLALYLNKSTVVLIQEIFWNVPLPIAQRASAAVTRVIGAQAANQQAVIAEILAKILAAQNEPQKSDE